MGFFQDGYPGLYNIHVIICTVLRLLELVVA